MSVTEKEPTCPSSVVKLFHTESGFISKESIEKGQSFKPRPEDVIICTSPKSGTTVVQQICQSLRSAGDMSFEEIDLVIPIVEAAYDHGYEDLHKPQPFQPQMFKSHFPYGIIPSSAGKYIYVVREPADVALSFFHYYENWIFQKGEVSLEDFVEWYYLGGKSSNNQKQNYNSMEHLMSWYPHRLDQNVLWLHYEDLIADLRKCVKIIAEFLNIGVDNNELQELATKQASIDFMKKYPTKYDEHHLKFVRNEVIGLPKYAGCTKENAGRVRNGKTNEGKKFIPPATLELIKEYWNERVTSATGYQTYDEFRNGINKELNREFS